MSEMTAPTEQTTETSENESNPFDATPPGVNPAWGKPKESQKKETKDPVPEKQEEKKAETQSEAEKKAEAALKKLKIKGREIEVDESKYHEYAQKGAAATETWQEAARMKREAEEFMTKLKADPMSVLKDPNMGVDFKKIAEDYMWEQIQEERKAEELRQMSPEQRQYMEAMKKAELYDKMQTEQQTKAEQEKAQQEESVWEQEFDQKFTKALQNSGLPKTTNAVRRMIDYAQQDLEAGVNRDPSEYAEAIYQDYMQEIGELFESLDGATILKFLGEPIAKKIREYDLSRLKKTQPENGYTFVPGKGMQKQDKPQKKLSGIDWEREVRRGFMG